MKPNVCSVVPFRISSLPVGVDDRMTVFMTDADVADQAIKFLVEKTGLNRTAFKAIVVEKIPRNEAGKILYGELNKIDT